MPINIAGIIYGVRTESKSRTIALSTKNFSLFETPFQYKGYVCVFVLSNPSSGFSHLPLLRLSDEYILKRKAALKHLKPKHHCQKKILWAHTIFQHKAPAHCEIQFLYLPNTCVIWYSLYCSLLGIFNIAIRAISTQS